MKIVFLFFWSIFIYLFAIFSYSTMTTMGHHKPAMINNLWSYYIFRNSMVCKLYSKKDIRRKQKMVPGQKIWYLERFDVSQTPDPINVSKWGIVELFLEFWLADTWFFADWSQHRDVTRLEIVRQSNVRRGWVSCKKLGFQLSHEHPQNIYLLL